MNTLWNRLRFMLFRLTLPAVLLAALATATSRGEEDSVNQKSQQIRKIVLSRGENPAALAHLVQLTKDMEKEAAAKLFRLLADDYLLAGQYNQAGSVLQQLVLQFPELPTGTEGLNTLLQLYTSSEVAHSQRGPTTSDEKKSSAGYALFLAEQALQKNRGLADHPDFAFHYAVAARLNGNPQSARSLLTPLKHNTRSQPWNHRAQTEGWISEQRKDSSPKQLLVCPTAAKKPHLDGVLDDKLWQTAGLVFIGPAMQKPETSDNTLVRISRDAEFLYLAIHCKKVAGVSYFADNLPRSHDVDLAQQDHVAIQLDCDRDYATSFTLAVDHRGQTSDACWLDMSWNPRWFVAANQDKTHWTIEVAIAWEELALNPPAAGESWALAMERRIPGKAAQIWPSTSGSPPAIDGFGLLVFE